MKYLAFFQMKSKGIILVIWVSISQNEITMEVCFSGLIKFIGEVPLMDMG